MVYFRDLERCCFTGERLVLPVNTRSPPNLQILHLFPAATSYDPEGKERQLLPLGLDTTVAIFFSVKRNSMAGWILALFVLGEIMSFTFVIPKS